MGHIGLIGDVHAEDELLEAALDYLKGKNVEAILCTGDVADGSAVSSRCCELFTKIMSSPFGVTMIAGSSRM